MSVNKTVMYTTYGIVNLLVQRLIYEITCGMSLLCTLSGVRKSSVVS